MELPSRPSHDRLLRPGALRDIRSRLRTQALRHPLRTVIINAFDWRTRMLPFYWSDIRMVPAGVRAIGSALLDSGFDRTRIVIQQWNRNVLPSHLQIDGQLPDLLCISTMQIHSAEAYRLVRDANSIPPDRRPLVIVGGPKAIYQPWDFFSPGNTSPASADVVCTGEEFVLLELLEALLESKGRDESLRSTFLRLRDRGELDRIQGLVFAPGQDEGPADELVDTGIQRLLHDLDELPHPVLGYSILEPPHRRRGISSRALARSRVARYNRITSLVLTFGCRFGCPYCPIPAYNQRMYRAKSGEQIADEMARLSVEFGFDSFFGADDNFFNDEERTVSIARVLARTKIDGEPLRHRLHWATEATVHDVLGMSKHLNLLRRAGLWAIWMGIEDMSGALVKKGQTSDATLEAFQLLRRNQMAPMPMMMHHDDQPLYTPGRMNGLVNQVRALRKAGAMSMQVLMLTPACGSKLYEETFQSGMVLRSAGSRVVQEHMYDGNYIIASRLRRPWRRQLNLLIAYMTFYNPLQLVRAMAGLRQRENVYRAGMQAVGMAGLVHNIARTLGWGLRLIFSKLRRHNSPPASIIPMRNPQGGPAAHDAAAAARDAQTPPAATPVARPRRQHDQAMQR